VSTNERTTIEELASLLALPLDAALAAVAIGIQLGFFKSRTAPALSAASEDIRWHSTWLDRVAPAAAPSPDVSQQQVRARV
jgi:hypothetical protein